MREVFVDHCCKWSNKGIEEVLNDDTNIRFDRNSENELINLEFAEVEIPKCTKKLKSSKAADADQILNEFMKSGADLLMPLSVKFFNPNPKIRQVSRSMGSGHYYTYIQE